MSHHSGSLLLLVGLGEGFRAGTEKSLADFGEDYMQIYNGRVPAVGASQLSSRQYYLNYQDYLDIRGSPYVRNATPVIYRGDLRLVSEYGSSNGYVDGSEPQFSDIRYQPVGQGRWLSWTDERQRSNVCVIGSEFVRLLFPGRPAVGGRLLINGVPKPILNAHSTHTIKVSANAANTIIMVFTAHLRWTMPPYKTASAGMLIKPTSVAAVICQALSPELSQLR